MSGDAEGMKEMFDSARHLAVDMMVLARGPHMMRTLATATPQKADEVVARLKGRGWIKDCACMPHNRYCPTVRGIAAISLMSVLEESVDEVVEELIEKEIKSCGK